MSNTVIKVENLGKQYRLGEVGTGTISHDLNRWWNRVRGKEDPYLKVGETNDRTKKGESNLVWALKDINFELKQGEAVGIIGRNGAGKSTMLKLLSRVTGPSLGNIKVKGRIAALLEVGTGFHPELTGRENVFLNGAILGMTKSEIIRKFDEIVDFSGVERYIDTPVKRYSSGMYVRLAFAVAAHLESEILIVDEVLAVGDAEFQKKCLGKMGDVSKGEGRTVLFVSHNLQAISAFCQKGIILDSGMLHSIKGVDESIHAYMGLMRDFKFNSETSKKDRKSRTSGKASFQKMGCYKNGLIDVSNWSYRADEDIHFAFNCITNEICDGLTFYMAFFDSATEKIVSNIKTIITPIKLNKGTEVEFKICVPSGNLRQGQYELYFAIGNTNATLWYDVIDSNINIPSLLILPVSDDVHQNTGYFNTTYKVYEKNV
jgi:lipopolysaccharide transport system ATP-binding protein